jgi:uncharacterized protein YjdB
MVFSLVFASCGGSSSDGGDPEVAAITVLPARLDFVVGGAVQTLAATVDPPNAAGRDSLTWSVDPPTGVVTLTPGASAAANTASVAPDAAGQATITVEAPNGVKATCPVTVENVPVTGVSISQASMSLGPDDACTLTATVEPAEATNKNVAWTVVPAVGVVDVAPNGTNGLGATVSAVGAGTATVTVTTEDGGHTAECTVHVDPVPVAGIALDRHSISLALGESDALVATVLPANATNKGVAWVSSNPAAADVTTAGVVTATGMGAATITATTLEGGFAASCGVTLVNVYMGGQMNMHPMLWKNGYAWMQDRTGAGTSWDTGRARCIVATDAGDVYVSGSETHLFDSGPDFYTVTVPRVWKNGSALYKLDAGYSEEAALSVFVHGDSVYSAGYSAEESGYMHPRLWKNDLLQALPSNGSAVANAVAATDEHVYVVGTDSGGTRLLAVLWEDGVATSLNTSQDSAYGNAVFVSGGDVYAGGQDSYRATIWKNGVPQTLGVPDCVLPEDESWGEYVSALFVAGGDVYAAGAYYDPHYDSYYNSSGWIATVWKNGEPTVLPWPAHADDAYLGSDALSVSVFGDDVYVSGYYTKNAGGWGCLAPVLWKNGRIVLDCAREGWWYWGENGWSLDGYTRGEAVFVGVATPGVESVSIAELPREWYQPAGAGACMAGFTKRLSAVVQPVNAPNGVAWASSNEAVAKVSGDGVVTGVAPGSATITATTVDGGKTAAHQMQILASTRVTAIALDRAEVSLGLNDYFSSLQADVQPSNATNRYVIWRSSDTSVVEVIHDQDYMRTASLWARGVGTSTITAATVDGGFTAVCTVNVAAAPAADTAIDMATVLPGRTKTGIREE